MKKHLLLPLIALTTIVVATGSHAAVLPASSGDVFLGVEDVSGTLTKNLLIDLGNYANIGSFTSENISSDLASVFGSGWSNNVNLDYGIYGINTVSSVIYLSQASTQPPGQNPQPLEPNITTQKGYYADFWQNEYNGAIHGAVTGGGTTANAVYVPVSDQYSWTALAGLNGNTVGGVFGDGSINPIENQIGSSLDLYENPLGNSYGTYLDLQALLNTTGVISITETVPEPSTYALLALGVVALLLARRRIAV